MNLCDRSIAGAEYVNSVLAVAEVDLQVINCIVDAAAHAETAQTILMVTHDPAAAVFADRVIFLSDGAIVRELRLEGDENVEAVIASLAELGD